ncbi:oligosaccharide repeat unit polymerase [Azonexus fungiphilus]|uniref:Oligosaccharide repeat unit polymerase n=1 Tax=Azonexus fungiphilus TaxID=146940 RepID=A0A495WFH8_9RHOO|nr:O-antigen polymerase [Azonexus fungiphilus]RKT60441.1 oligosaccharide repeat unit polymerase [Azonexus fungiphilus]
MILFFAFCVIWYSVSRGDKDPFKPEIFINLYYFIMVVSGPIVIYLFFPDIYQDGLYAEVLELLSMSLLCMNIGFILSGYCFNKPRVFSKELVDTQGILRLAQIFLLVGLFSGVFFYLRAGNIPIISDNKEVARVMALSVSGNGYFLYLMTLVMPAVSLWAINCFSDKKNKSVYFIVVLATIAGLFLTGTGSRRYIIWIYVYVLVVYHYIVRPLPLSKFFAVGIGAFVFVVLFELFRNPFSDTTADFYTAVLYRLVIFSSNLEKVFSAFYYGGEFFYGKTFFMDILTVLPGKQDDYQSWLKEYVGLSFEGFGIPPTMAGDFYINFGMPGVIVLSLAFGFFVRSVYFFLVVNRFSYYSVFAYCLLLEVFVKMLTSGLSAQSISLIWVALILAVVRYFSPFLRKSQ